MPARLRLPVPACLAYLACVLLAAAPPARASDAAALAAASGAAAKPAHAGAAGPLAPAGVASVVNPVDARAAGARSAAAAAAAEAVDPMLRLRERLSEKLGATKVPQPGVNVVRVSANSPSGETANELRLTPGASVRRAARPVASPAPAHPAHWDYKGAGGPANWGALNPEFAKCSSGTRQSPIDIRDGIKLQLDPVRFDYRPSDFRVIDNGHTVQVNVGAGNSIEILGRRFDLLQFHFHRPSEERVDGRQFDMVAHLVHKDLNGSLAVVAVLLDRGSAQPLIQTVWNNLPLEKGEELGAPGTIDLNALLPPDRSYFTYMGSLTTPPCNEGVLWMVLKQPVNVSAEQISIFSRLYPMNARPVQSAGGRLIKESF